MSVYGLSFNLSSYHRSLIKSIVSDGQQKKFHFNLRGEVSGDLGAVSVVLEDCLDRDLVIVRQLECSDTCFLSHSWNQYRKSVYFRHCAMQCSFSIFAICTFLLQILCIYFRCRELNDWNEMFIFADWCLVHLVRVSIILLCCNFALWEALEIWDWNIYGDNVF